MRAVIALSVILGLAWNVLALPLMGGRLVDALTPAWLTAGVCAGVAAGLFTVWSRLRVDGRESLLHVLSAFYGSIVVYWLTFLVAERLIMCVEHGGWTSFDLRDHFVLIVPFLVYCTVGAGLLLLPFTLLFRLLIWKVYTRT